MIKLYGGMLGPEFTIVNCDLSNPTAPIVIHQYDDDGWMTSTVTKYQTSDCGAFLGLIEIARQLAADACEVPLDDVECKWCECDENGEAKSDGQELPPIKPDRAHGQGWRV